MVRFRATCIVTVLEVHEFSAFLAEFVVES